MSEKKVAISIKNLTKVYKVYATRKDFVLETFIRKTRHSKKVTLDNISIEVKRGEIVGVLGRNGAGKSTLLKLIAGTLHKTSGDLVVNGRLTAILELGSGFHPDYTGRENIYMGGMCLGMSRNEIDRKLNEIIRFSELENVIDQPFRTYSTGMQARLTFSTAISVDPDILIIDEALSVGDARFQAKCFARIKKLRDSNTTILLVSHDTGTITSLCDRAIILEAGKIYAEGNAKEISIAYHNLLFGNRSKNLSTGNEEFQKAQKYKDITTQSFVRYGTGEAQIESWEVLDEDSKPSAVLITGSKFKLAMTFLSKADISDLTFGFAIKDTRGTVLWGVTNMSYFERPNFVSDGEKIRVFADCTLWLSAGHYTVSLGLAHLEDGEKIDFIEDALVIRVVGPGRIFTTSVVNLDTTLHIISC